MRIEEGVNVNRRVSPGNWSGKVKGSKTHHGGRCWNDKVFDQAVSNLVSQGYPIDNPPLRQNRYVHSW